jgi:hypothetical protein
MPKVPCLDCYPNTADDLSYNSLRLIHIDFADLAALDTIFCFTSTPSAQSHVSGMKVILDVLKDASPAEIFAHLLKLTDALLVHVLGCPVLQLLFECQRSHLPEIIVEVWLLHGLQGRRLALKSIRQPTPDFRVYFFLLAIEYGLRVAVIGAVRCNLKAISFHKSGSMPYLTAASRHAWNSFSASR